ncbi:SRPBCC family protein [Arthrobacter sp. PsM3]|uniref:SRPBCC family protein n=1 Tax=Arthrobacter sp. PsM3 TaxID=3030531 RepID=UPI00263B23FB|nr:SRPBCC family protein [Arthrobacter sp. PsM3]MDN4643701.1 SRPBCC family protein [Arthrobacter sp. PsM3]
MAKLTKSITINAPVEKVFDFARDVGRLWACFPEVAVRDVEVKPDGVGSSPMVHAHAGDPQRRNHRIRRGRPQPAHRREVLGRPVSTNMFEAEAGGTKLTVDAEWHLPVPPAGPPVEALIMKRSEKDGEAMLAGIKVQVEGTAA